MTFLSGNVTLEFRKISISITIVSFLIAGTTGISFADHKPNHSSPNPSDENFTVLTGTGGPYSGLGREFFD